MENLNNKLEGIKNLVRKIKNEMKNYEQKEKSNSHIRANTVSNKTYRNYINNISNTFNKFKLDKNSNLIKTYFKMPSKEKNIKDNILNINELIKINKKFYNRNDLKNGKMGLKSSQTYKYDNKENLFEYINERQKKHSRQNNENDKNRINYFDKIIMTYTNEDNLDNIKNNILKNYYTNNGNKNFFNLRNQNVFNEEEKIKLNNNDNEDTSNISKNGSNNNLINLQINNNKKMNMKKYCGINDFCINNFNNTLFEQNKLKEILGNENIDDILSKAKLFEKFCQDKYQYFINNHFDIKNKNNNINNLKTFKNYLSKINRENEDYQKQIDFYRKLTKKLFNLIDNKKREEIIKKIQLKYINDEEKDNFVIDEINKILYN